jgi:hypothetical protein
VLPGADFSDAYRVVVCAADLNAQLASEVIFQRSPICVGQMGALRDRICARLGLKSLIGCRPGVDGAHKSIGGMNILSETPNEVLLGRDSGLFACRVSIAVRSVDKQRRQVTITTHIRNRNLLGRMWTAAVAPFHRKVVPRMLQSLTA